MNRIIIALLLSISCASHSQIINTIAGNGAVGFSGDGGPASAAELNSPRGITSDAAGNVYIADRDNNRIRIINSSGVISTFAGNGIIGYSGDGGPATDAELHLPQSLKSDALGNVYIADYYNSCIRIVNTSGIVTTIAGNGVAGFSGDGGPATAAEINLPQDVEFDASGNLYIADMSNNRVRLVNTSGIITTIAGNGTGGYSGDGGPATAAEFFNPQSILCDASGNIYIADFINNRIRIVNSSGIVNTFAGESFRGFSGDGWPATAAELYDPTGIAIDVSGNIYISDEGNNRIRIINTSGIIETFAGNGYGAPTRGAFSGDGGPATSAELYFPLGVSSDASGNTYIGDSQNYRIRKVGTVSTGIYSELAVENFPLTIHPSPTFGMFFVSGISQGNIIELYNYTGQLLSSKIADNPTINFDISNSTNGIYLIRVLSKYGSVIATKKILKTN